ncbi:MAG: methyltransferase, TIGR04325 family [bacterium]
MLGAFPNRTAALAAVPRRWIATYDHSDVAAVNFAVMCAVRIWDYPVMFWLEKLHEPGMTILDAGGHFGTKYIAFRGLLKLHDVSWTVYDLPETVSAGRAAQLRGDVPMEVGFTDDLAKVLPTDLLLASGLLQYLDIPFPDFLARLPNRPRHILLNKVATRDGPSVTTLERIGPARVPYQIRCRGAFEGELADAGYRIADSWEIASLGHVIDTHPDLGRSVSRGYLLQRTD